MNRNYLGLKIARVLVFLLIGKLAFHSAVAATYQSSFEDYEHKIVKLFKYSAVTKRFGLGNPYQEAQITYIDLSSASEKHLPCVANICSQNLNNPSKFSALINSSAAYIKLADRSSTGGSTEKVIDELQLMPSNLAANAEGLNLIAVIEDQDGYTNLRSKDSVKSAVIQKIPSGDFIYTSQQANAWWKVRSKDGNAGYIHASRLRVMKTPSCPATYLLPKLKEFSASCQLTKSESSCNSFSQTFKELLKKYDCSREQDQGIPVPALWLVGDKALGNYVEQISKLKITSAIQIFASEDFRGILDGELAERYHSASQKAEKLMPKH